DFASGCVTGGASQNAFVWVNGIAATASGSSCTGSYWTANAPIASQSGPHPMTITWQQKYGTVPKPNGNPQNCSTVQGCSGAFDCTGGGVLNGSGCVEQQAFSATND